MKARSAVVGTLLLVLLLSAMYPIRQYISQKSKVAALQAEEQLLADKITELRTTRSRLMTDAEVERIAREELGMVRPGEVAFAIVPGGAPAAVEKRAKAPAVRAAPAGSGPSWFDRWWSVVVRSLTGMR